MRTHTNNNNNQKSEMQNQKSMFSFFRNQTHLKQKSRNNSGIRQERTEILKSEKKIFFEN